MNGEYTYLKLVIFSLTFLLYSVICVAFYDGFGGSFLK